MYYGKYEMGKVIRRLRIEKQLSLEEVAEHCGVDSKYIKEVEEDLHPEIDLTTIWDIAISFNMKAAELIMEIDQENEDYYRRIRERRGNRKKLFDRRRQIKLALRKEITNNFKNKHSIHQLKMKKHF